MIGCNLQENLLLEPMFEVPGSDIKAVHITEECVRGNHQPIYVMRSAGASASNTSPDGPENSQSHSTEEETTENRKVRVNQ